MRIILVYMYIKYSIFYRIYNIQLIYKIQQVLITILCLLSLLKQVFEIQAAENGCF